jgi:hypothetical protein
MAAIWVSALLFRIRKVPRSNPEPEIEYFEDFRNFPEVNWVSALLFCIRKVPRSNPESEIDYFEDFRNFPEANSRIVPQIRPRPLPSIPLLNHRPTIRRYVVSASDSREISYK